LFAASLPITGVVANAVQPSLNNNAPQAIVITAQEAEVRKEKAEAVDAFFAKLNSPLVGYGEKFVEEAEKNDLDWRLTAAIAARESTAYRNACKSAKGKNNGFGWGGCKIGFDSVDEAIEVVSKHLGGNSESTAKHYEGKTTLQILRKYNTVVKTYPNEVVRIMKMIDDSEDVA
jgi:hypothetical protein